MRRTPIVLVTTAAGLVGVLSFHTKSASLTLSGLPGAGTRGSSTPSAAAGPPRGPGSTGSGAPPTSGSSVTSTTTPAAPSSSTTGSSTTRSAKGPLVNYNYGILSVSVTTSGKKITHVGIASLDDGGNFRSQSIDQQSIPILEQQALQAQSANIQGVSGASYTSAGFEQSLQSALSKLGLA
jgi:uncharacterized protein with FMN-binding domain